jgi:hypothetical protein
MANEEGERLSLGRKRRCDLEFVDRDGAFRLPRRSVDEGRQQRTRQPPDTRWHSPPPAARQRAAAMGKDRGRRGK